MFQGAVPQIIERTSDDFFMKIVNIVRQTAYLCYDKIMEIPCIMCPHKPEASLFLMVSNQ